MTEPQAGTGPEPVPLVGVRCLLGMVGLDVHSKGIRTLSRQLRDRGAEVVYVGEHNMPEGIARAAVAEDVDVIGLSFSTTTYLEATRAVLTALADCGAQGIPLMLGGLIHRDDEAALREMGVAEVFGPGSNLSDVTRFLLGLRDGASTAGRIG